MHLNILRKSSFFDKINYEREATFETILTETLQ